MPLKIEWRDIGEARDSLLQKLITTHRVGWSLARPFYTDPQIFELDMERIFADGWLLAGHSSEIPNVGDYFLFQVGSDSLIITQGDDGQIHALFNVCRHRGMRICNDVKGQRKSLTCPYHAWVYGLDGALRSSRAMPESFEPSLFNLRRAAVRLVEGLIFINPSGQAAKFDEVARDVTPFLKQHGLVQAKVCHRMSWMVQANWKLFIENFGECYHCGISHPEYCAVMAHAIPEASGSPTLLQEFDAWTAEWEEFARGLGHLTGVIEPSPDRLHTCLRIPMRRGAKSQAQSGKQVAPLMGEFKQSDGGITSVRIYPSSYFIGNCDYGVLFRFVPLTVTQTRVDVSWLVHREAVEGRDYDLSDLTWLWRVTTEQDNQLVEANQAGVSSSAYEPGPYATVEDACVRFTRWYLRQISG